MRRNEKKNPKSMLSMLWRSQQASALHFENWSTTRIKKHSIFFWYLQSFIPVITLRTFLCRQILNFSLESGVSPCTLQHSALSCCHAAFHILQPYAHSLYWCAKQGLVCVSQWQGERKRDCVVCRLSKTVSASLHRCVKTIFCYCDYK